MISTQHFAIPNSNNGITLSQLPPLGDHLETLYATDELESTREWIVNPDSHEYIGDVMPEPKPDTSTRIYFQNLNGVSWDSDGGRWPYVCEVMATIQADISCFVETNTDTNKYKIREKMETISQRQFDQSRLVMAASKTSSASHYKPGGTAILAVNSITANIQNHTRDRMGRWASVSFTTQRSKKVRIISAYQVCPGTRQGSNTASSQQQAQIIEEASRVGQRQRQSPRQSFIHDLQQFIQHLQYQDEEIVLLGDFNEEMATVSSGIDNLASACGLVDLFGVRLGSPHIPATYQRGTRRLDYALLSPSLLNHVKAAGYDPFSYRIPSDHRGFYLDVDTEAVFNQEIHPLASAKRRDFYTTTPAIVRQYVSAKIKYLNEHQFFARLQNLMTTSEANHDCAESLDRDLQRAAVHAAKQCAPRPQPPWSPRLAQCWAKLQYYRLARSSLRTNINLRPAISKLQQQWPMLPQTIPTTLEEIEDGYKAALHQLRSIRHEAQAAREEHLHKRLEIYQATDDKSRAKIVRRMIHAESQKRVYKKLQYLRQQPSDSAGLSFLKVPKNVSVTDTETMKDLPDTEEEWEKITVPREIERLLLHRNQHHFGQAEGTPFTKHPLQADVGYKGDGIAADMILRGNIEYASIPTATSLLIRHLHKRTSATLDGQITKTDILNKLKSWKEGTTTSPSGIHLGHYHCMWRPPSADPTDPENQIIKSKQNQLLQAVTDLLNYALKHRYSYERWRTVINVMLKKDANNPRIHRLRVIHIYEADYNLMLAVKWRQAMHFAEDRKLLNDGLYGSRPGRTAHDPVLLEILQHEIYRMSMKTGINFDLDATSCYDRILINVASLCNQRIGMHQSVVFVNAQTLEQAKYYLKTNLGISEQFYTHSPRHPIHGTGQGSGNSPFVWCFVCSALFDAFEARAHGAHFTTYNGATRVRIYMIGFVDDCSQRVNMFDTEPQPSFSLLLQRMERDAQLWNDLLWSSGGALEHSKCSFHLISSKWTSDGQPFLNGDTCDHEIPLHHSHRITTVRQMSNYKTHKTLGCYVNPAHIQKEAFDRLRQRNETFAQILDTNYLTRDEAWTFYTSFYLPSITYSLPMTPLSHSQCDQLDIRFLRSLIPKVGYNRNMSRAIRYAPRYIGGAGFRPLYAEQGIAMIKQAYKFLNSPHTTIGKMMIATLSWTQAFLGISAPLLTDTHCRIPPVGPSWVLDLRTFLRDINGVFILQDYPVEKTLRAQDRFIMDIALAQSQWSNQQLIQINSCRRYLQSQTLADITTATGTRLLPHVMSGSRAPLPQEVRVAMFNQQRPGAKAWKTWGRFLHTIAKRTGLLYTPLGQWLTTYDQTRHWPKFVYDERNDRLFSHVEHNKYVEHQRQRSRTFSIQPSSTMVAPNGCPTAVHISSDHLIPAASTTTSRCRGRWAAAQSIPSQSWEERIQQYIEVPMSMSDLRNSLARGRFIICSDGSVNQDQGTFGFVMSTTEGTRMVRGSGRALGSYSNSFRSEAFGALSAVKWLHNMLHLTNIQIPEPVTIRHYMDNQSVIRRINREYDTKYCIPNRRLLPDQDVIAELVHILRTISVHVQYQWVRGHQDQATPFHRLPLEAQLNCEADSLASQPLETHATLSDSSPFFTTTPCQLVIHNKTVTGRFQQRIYEALTIPPLRSYLTKKHHWDETVLEEIDWNNFTHTIKKYRNSWTTLVKHLHDINPTGHIAHRNNPVLPHECPACGQPQEDNLHVILCRSPSHSHWRQLLLQKIQQFDDQDSDPYMIDILQDGLRRLHLRDMGPDATQYPPQYRTLIYSQNSIGWHQLYKGRWSQQWRILHDRYKENHPTKSTIRQGSMWVLIVSRLMIDQWFLLWKIRNEERHGKDETTKSQIQAQITKATLAELYALKDTVCPVDRHIFYETLTEHEEKHSIASINQWIDTYREAIKSSALLAKQLGIQRNRSILFYSTDNPVSQPSGQASLTAGSATG